MRSCPVALLVLAAPQAQTAAIDASQFLKLTESSALATMDYRGARIAKATRSLLQAPPVQKLARAAAAAGARMEAEALSQLPPKFASTALTTIVTAPRGRRRAVAGIARVISVGGGAARMSPFFTKRIGGAVVSASAPPVALALGPAPAVLLGFVPTAICIVCSLQGPELRRLGKRAIAALRSPLPQSIVQTASPQPADESDRSFQFAALALLLLVNVFAVALWVCQRKVGSNSKAETTETDGVRLRGHTRLSPASATLTRSGPCVFQRRPGV